jgi:hypothetical protein
MFHIHAPIIPKDPLKLMDKVEASFSTPLTGVRWGSYWEIVLAIP